ncbi:hypothetical protein HNO88_002981 [Novosphingobium chloroacetimidivorans]|uniref:Holliday junction resolvase RuvC n=1 Tax=Novosphingobium chloroacetimidivorans TaxID=1428314 RepID=A0A7W7KB91_9SPHN|nr:hypothetical protein [Novosphingobium chloroacetimidivorans]MBB4859652.1 hypothetical protein [Novosphingobium chloroacetimidivorans]
MSYLALDLSKSSTGWALWAPGSDAPRYGHWQLGSEWTTEGGCYAKLHRNLSDLHKVAGFTHLYFEEPINPGHLTGNTSIATIWLLSGLAAHAQSFGHIKRCRIVKAVNVERWRKDFIGDMVVREVKAGTRRRRKAGDSKASSTDQLKKLVIERCKQFGFAPRKNDEADAIGILTYSLLLDGVTPPWIANETLRPALQGVAA